MSVFALCEANEYGDIVPTGEVHVPYSILSKIFQEDVQEELGRMNLPKELEEEAFMAWVNYKKFLIKEEEELFWDDLMRHDKIEDDDSNFILAVKRRKNLCRECQKRGQNRLQRHKYFEKRKKIERAKKR